MTNYLTRLLATLLFAGACCAADAPGPARYTQLPGSGSLKFGFVQAGADSQGEFRQFATELTWDPARPAAGSLKVTVQTGSLDTQDKDRDEVLRGGDLFDAQQFPTAQFVAQSFAPRAAGGFDAVGKLTLRGVTRDLRLPVTLKSSANGIEISGEVTIKRLDHGVGQGEWKSTEWVGDEVKLRYQVPLTRAK